MNLLNLKEKDKYVVDLKLGSGDRRHCGLSHSCSTVRFPSFDFGQVICKGQGLQAETLF